MFRTLFVDVALGLAGLAACGGQPQVIDPAPRGTTPVRLIVTPADVALFPADTQRFRAHGVTATGDSVGATASFAATGGTVTADGLFQAGPLPGDYQIVATAVGGAASGIARVAVQPNGRPLANECAAPQPEWIWCDDFDQDRLAKYFEFDQAQGAFVRMDGVGNDGSAGMRGRFAAGQVSAGSLHLAFGKTPQPYFRPVDAGTASYREIYWRVFIKNAPTWTGGGGFKLTRATSFSSSTTWAQAMIAHLWSGSSAPRHNHLVIDPASGTNPAGTVVTTKYNDFDNLRWLGSVQGKTPVFASPNIGKWHCVEAHVRLNDANRSNGVFQVWIDGQPDAGRSDLNWVGGYSSYGINAIFLENYWNTGAPVAQERYFDNFVVSTKPIGC